MLEAIGGLTLVFGGGWLFVMFMRNLEEEKKEREKLIRESWTCRILISDYQKSVENGNPVMSKKELEKKLKEIISRPEELSKIRKSREFKIKREEENKDSVKRNRIFGYKHENQIFEIFGTARELSKFYVVQEIGKTYNLNNSESEELFQAWTKHNLIKKCVWNKEKYEIEYTLDSDLMNLDENDLTRSKWLKMKGLSLDPESPEYHEWFKQFPDLSYLK